MTPEEIFCKLTDDELAALADMADVQVEAGRSSKSGSA
jgi:hypothetical protein